MAAPRDPEELDAAGAPAEVLIAATTTLGAVHLTVSDLRRSIAYYESAIGLRQVRGGDGAAVLAPGEDARGELLVLHEQAGARPAPRSTGLYHFALLLPRRADLARWLAHAARERIALTGASDHFVSEALYLSDPDGHGIEIYWDRPRETWEGRVAQRMTTVALDVGSLLGELEDPAGEGFDGLPRGTVMGHVHLKVADVGETVGFYRDVLGFGLMAELAGSAAFLAAGGYHHHVGANTWDSLGAPPPPPGSAALRLATIALPDEDERARVLARLRAAGRPAVEGELGPVVRDPSGNALLLRLAGGG